MIYLGIDDTDTLDSRGTNQLARLIAERLVAEFQIVWIVRHQLFFDRRVPYTSKNGSASLTLSPRRAFCLKNLGERVASWMREEFIPGSDPGLCVCAAQISDEVVTFSHRCQHELIQQSEARELAARLGIFLVGLGGTEDGVIGALAAIGLACGGNDGRIVQLGDQAENTDNIWGEQPISALAKIGVVVRTLAGDMVEHGWVDVGKKLRPNLRNGQAVQFAEPTSTPDHWRGVKRT